MIFAGALCVVISACSPAGEVEFVAGDVVALNADPSIVCVVGETSRRNRLSERIRVRCPHYGGWLSVRVDEVHRPENNS